MELSYKQVELTLVGHLKIHPDRVGTFRSRMKQLQRLEFPEGVNVGRGEKVRYSLANLFQLVTAFELINMGYPASLATFTVMAKWKNFSSAYGLSLWMRRHLSVEDVIFARVMNIALNDLRGEELPAVYPNVYVEDEESLVERLKRNDKRMTNTYPLLCISDITTSIVEKVQSFAQASNPVYDEEVVSWHIDDSDRDRWMMAKQGWLRFGKEPPPGQAPPFVSDALYQLTVKHYDILSRYREMPPSEIEVTDEEAKELGPDYIEDGWWGNSLTSFGELVFAYLHRRHTSGKRS